MSKFPRYREPRAEAVVSLLLVTIVMLAGAMSFGFGGALAAVMLSFTLRPVARWMLGQAADQPIAVPIPVRSR